MGFIMNLIIATVREYRCIQRKIFVLRDSVKLFVRLTLFVQWLPLNIIIITIVVVLLLECMWLYWMFAEQMMQIHPRCIRVMETLWVGIDTLVSINIISVTRWIII